MLLLLVLLVVIVAIGIGIGQNRNSIVSTIMSLTGLPSFRMVALDLDGTLLQSNHSMTEETAAYLRELDHDGFRVMVTTGRSATTVYEHIRRLQFQRPIPVVCSNGARGLLCHVNETDDSMVVEELFSIPVPQDIVTRTIALAKELGHVTQYYVGEHIYANPSQPSHLILTELYQELTGCTTIYVQDDFQQASEQGLPSKLLVLCPVEQQEAMMEAFYKEFDNTMATIIHGSMGWFLEVLHPQVCKGHGLTKICQFLNIDINHVLAFGDGDNDLEFIQLAGRGIVMKNGRDVVKQVADEVIDLTNDEDGVRRTLQQMQLNGQLIFHSYETNPLP